MRRVLLLLAVLVLAPCEVSAQAFDFGPRIVRFGHVTETTRLGTNHGNAMAFALRVESGWLRATAWTAETQAVTGINGSNPAPDARYDDVTLHGLTMGPGVRVGPLGVALGAGAFVMTCPFHACGSSPIYDALLSADADLCSPGRMRVCARAGMEAVAPREGQWTWLRRDWGGDASKRWMYVANVGLTVGLQP